MKTAFVLLSVPLLASVVACKKGASPTPDPSASGNVTSTTPKDGKIGDVMGGGFEGDISFRVENKKKAGQKPIDVALHIKKDKVRIDAPPEMVADMGKMTGGGNVYGLVHAGDKKLYGVVENQKKAIMIDLDKQADELRGMAGGAKRPSAPNQPPDLSKIPKVTRTGQKAKVAGFDCEDWKFESQDPAKKQHATVCIAETDGGSWLKLPTKILPDQLGVLAELMDGRHLPVRLIAFEGDKEEMRVEATKIEKKTIPDTQVNVPADYQVTDMMTFMMGGLRDVGGQGRLPGSNNGLGGLSMPPPKPTPKPGH